MNPSDTHLEPLLRWRRLVPELLDLFGIAETESAQHWVNLDAGLLPLLDRQLPLMVAVCGGANSGKSTLFNSLLQVRLSPVRSDAGSTRRVLAAVNPGLLGRKDFLGSLFAPFGMVPGPLAEAADLLEPGPPLYLSHPEVPPEQVLLDTPDFDTGSADRYLNRHIAREVLEACNVLIYVVTNTTYNNLENTRFMRERLTETGLRRCVLVYNCSRALEDNQVADHLARTAANLYGSAVRDYLIGTYRTDTSDAVAAGQEFMSLRPVRPGDPGLMRLLRNLDPREIWAGQIQTTLEAYSRHLRRVIAEAGEARDEMELYAGTVRLAVGRAVQQSLVSVPLKKIMQRMNTIWLETSPPYLKLFRGVGSALGRPARLILSLVRKVQGLEEDGNRAPAHTVDPLEQIESNLLGAASELRDHLLATEILAETVAREPEGARLVSLVDGLRRLRGLKDSQLPFRQSSAGTGTVLLHVGVPGSLSAARKAVEERSWSETVERLAATARTLLEINENSPLDRESDRPGRRLPGADGFFSKDAGVLFCFPERSAGYPGPGLYSDHRGPGGGQRHLRQTARVVRPARHVGPGFHSRFGRTG